MLPIDLPIRFFRKPYDDILRRTRRKPHVGKPSGRNVDPPASSCRLTILVSMLRHNQALVESPRCGKMIKKPAG